MSRTDVFEATGPTSGTYIKVKMAVKGDRSRLCRRRSRTKQAPIRAPRLAPGPCACSRRTTSRTSNINTYDVVVNRPEDSRLPRARRPGRGLRQRKRRRSNSPRAEDRPAPVAPRQRLPRRHAGTVMGVAVPAHRPRRRPSRRRWIRPITTLAHRRPEPRPRRRLRVTGSTAACSRASSPPSTAMAPSTSSKARPTSAAPAHRSRCSSPRRSASPTKTSAHRRRYRLRRLQRRHRRQPRRPSPRAWPCSKRAWTSAAR